MLSLGSLQKTPGATHQRKRLGRGSGSGQGQTAGKGSKGQLARTGGKVRRGFEGGQMPLYRRVPKRGFTSLAIKTGRCVVNVGDLKEINGTDVNFETLRAAGLISSGAREVVLLGTGEVSQKYTVSVSRLSDAAKKKIESAGGSIKD